MELPKFKVEDREYQLEKLLTEKQTQALRATYLRVREELMGKTEEERRKYKWDTMPEQLAVTNKTLRHAFGFRKDEIDNMDNLVTMKLFSVLMEYIFTGRVKEFP